MSVSSLAVIDEGVHIGVGVSIEPFTIIKKGTVIEDGARISSCARIEEHCFIGENTFIGHGVVMRPGTLICHDCKVGHLTVFEGSSKINYGTLIQSQSNITRGVTIGERVFIGMQFCGGNDRDMVHERWEHYGKFSPSPYTIEDFARIGFGVHVLPNVSIGKNSLVAAGSLVTTNVPEDAKVKGRPAKVYGEVPRECRL